MNAEKRNVIDRRAVRLEKVLSKDFIPFLGGRPDRATVISNEDITNLAIAINTAASLDEFMLLI